MVVVVVVIVEDDCDEERGQWEDILRSIYTQVQRGLFTGQTFTTSYSFKPRPATSFAPESQPLHSSERHTRHAYPMLALDLDQDDTNDILGLVTNELLPIVSYKPADACSKLILVTYLAHLARVEFTILASCNGLSQSLQLCAHP